MAASGGPPWFGVQLSPPSSEKLIELLTPISWPTQTRLLCWPRTSESATAMGSSEAVLVTGAERSSQLPSQDFGSAGVASCGNLSHSVRRPERMKASFESGLYPIEGSPWLPLSSAGGMYCW